MADLPRVVISPGLFRVSLPGINVLNPASITPAHLSISSDWSRIERIHSIRSVKNTNLQTDRTVNFAALSEPPFPILLIRAVGGVRLYDPNTHESVYQGEEVIEDTHLIRYTTRSTCVLAQQPRRVESGSGVRNIYDPSRFDFIVVLIKHD